MEPLVVRRLRPELLITVGALALLVIVAVVGLDFSPLFIVLAGAVAGLNLWLGSVVLRIDGAGVRYAHGRRVRFLPWEVVEDVTAASDTVTVRTREGSARIPVRRLDEQAVAEAVRLNRG